ncbi:MAG: hypothetical protein WA977_05520 [Halobacteriota archaeon]
MAGLENILMGVSYLHPFFSAKFSASAICLILRCCVVGGVERMAWASGATPAWHLAAHHANF